MGAGVVDPVPGGFHRVMDDTPQGVITFITTENRQAQWDEFPESAA